MKIKAYTTDFFDSNIYLFERNDQKILIDCGGTEEGIENLLLTLGFWPDYVLLTHGHIDHILSLPLFAEKDTKVFVHKADAKFLSDPTYNLSPHLIGQRFTWNHKFYDYQELPEDLGIAVIHTPGHTPGSVCLLIEDHLFTGDTLFCGGIGNTAFPGGDYGAEISSVRKLLTLSGNINVYPGHGCSTTIADEQNTI